ncbi:hypothetical protein [Gracilibacillus phocaeensis]|uniref:hypothetical protein n=1 Tax=Gracilibacillus phocaeensis TaxID=2042304 RepID=UPI0013EEFEFB|nr:hypothetical protein [Gracilibacillus phocaeensis]
MNYWMERQVAIEKSLQVISERISFRKNQALTEDEYHHLSSMRTAFRELSILFQRIPSLISDTDSSYTLSTCSHVTLETEEDIRKRVTEYYELFNDFDRLNLGNEIYQKTVDKWDKKQSYQVRSCANW